MEKYDNLDGLRTVSCIGIVAMHIRANAEYQITGWFWNNLLPSLTLLVYLFLMISGFGMFCGYYEQVRCGNLDWNQFYMKRYKKILPFYAFLILIDLTFERSAGYLIEGITEVTLVFGLLPNNNPSVIGVGWTLGVIFLFYCCFRFLSGFAGRKKEPGCRLQFPVHSQYFAVYIFLQKILLYPAFRRGTIFCTVHPIL